MALALLRGTSNPFDSSNRLDATMKGLAESTHSRVLVSQLVVEVLDGLLQDGRRDFWELDLAQLRFREATCV